MFESLFRPGKARTRDVAPTATRAPEHKAMSPLIALTLPGRAPSWSPRDYASLVREGVMANAIAYRCVRMIAEAAASVPWLLYEGAVEIETHPLLTLLTAPNTMESGAVLFERCAAWTKSLLDNAARPSGALIYKGPDGAPGLTADQFARLKSELENAYAGAVNAGKPMVLEGGLDWRAMSYTPSDMDFSDIRNSAAREIARRDRTHG